MYGIGSLFDAPITCYFWINTSSANAKFYFAMTMVFSVTQIWTYDEAQIWIAWL